MVRDARLEKQLRMAVEAASDEEGWANLAKVGALINKQHPDFDPRTFGYLKLSDLIIATALFDIERKRPGEGKAIVVYARDKRRKGISPNAPLDGLEKQLSSLSWRQTSSQEVTPH